MVNWSSRLISHQALRSEPPTSTSNPWSPEETSLCDLSSCRLSWIKCTSIHVHYESVESAHYDQSCRIPRPLLTLPRPLYVPLRPTSVLCILKLSGLSWLLFCSRLLGVADSALVFIRRWDEAQTLDTHIKSSCFTLTFPPHTGPDTSSRPRCIIQILTSSFFFYMPQSQDKQIEPISSVEIALKITTANVEMYYLHPPNPIYFMHISPSKLNTAHSLCGEITLKRLDALSYRSAPSQPEHLAF